MTLPNVVQKKASVLTYTITPPAPITLDAAPTPGNWLLAVAGGPAPSGLVLVPPSGFTPVDSQVAGGGYTFVSIGIRKVQSGDSDTWSFTSTGTYAPGSYGWAGVIYEIADSGTPIETGAVCSTPPVILSQGVPVGSLSFNAVGVFNDLGDPGFFQDTGGLGIWTNVLDSGTVSSKATSTEYHFPYMAGAQIYFPPASSPPVSGPGFFAIL